MTLQPILITDFDKGGLETDVKPFMLINQAFQTLQNAYIYRQRVKKRIGNKLIGRLRRVFLNTSIGNISAVGAGTFTFNIFTGLGIIGNAPPVINEVNAQFQTGDQQTITITIGAPISQTLTDSTGTGAMIITGAGPITAANINYTTGVLTLTFSGAVAASAATFSGAYYPMLPSMGIFQRELATVNLEQSILFDTKYAYTISSGEFQELVPGFTWNGSDSDFFYIANYRGIAPSDRYFFATNYNSSALNPMRYFDGITWNTFAPIVSDVPESPSQITLLSAQILIPYYGRLVALNTWEGNAYSTQLNFYNRCRFSQIGDPTNVDAWRSDIFGKGGFVDAPTNEDIRGAYFYKNTLLVDFEKSTWQLRYVGEYGFPFQWERISSDYGSESAFSGVLFDEGVLSVGYNAVKGATAVNCSRIDEKIPDLVFEMRNDSMGPQRIYGIRDFQRELVFWAYVDSNSLDPTQVFPNKVLVFNYRTQTFSIFDDRVTCFGTVQSPDAVTWDSLTVTWDDMDVLWDDVDTQDLFPDICMGNSQGYIMKFGYVTEDETSLAITSVDMTVSPNTLTIPKHNMNMEDSDSGTIIYVTGLLYSSPPPFDLNKAFYKATFVDVNTVSLSTWNTVSQSWDNTPIQGASSYIGGGQIQVFPRMSLVTKDFNPYEDQGQQIFMAYVHFLTDATPDSQVYVAANVNGGNVVQGNMLVGNTNVETSLSGPLYTPGSEFAWHAFYATIYGQFIRLNITYDDNLMTQLTTHQSDYVLHKMKLWCRPAGRLI